MRIQSLPNHQQPNRLQPPVQASQSPDPKDRRDPDPAPAPERPWGKALVRGAIYGAVGTLLGAGMTDGGAGGLVCGALAGGTLGTVTVGPMGNGKGAEGLVYPALGLAGGAIAGGVMGAMGLTHGALIVGGTLGLIQAGRTLLQD